MNSQFLLRLHSDAIVVVVVVVVAVIMVPEWVWLGKWSPLVLGVMAVVACCRYRCTGAGVGVSDAVVPWLLFQHFIIRSFAGRLQSCADRKSMHKW